jgi:uncharacterized membrane protein
MSLFRPRKELLTPAEQERVVSAIRASEAKTTGEIRVFVESKCSYMDAMDRAVELFSKLGMEATERRNAVIVYLAVTDRQFAIYGDREIFEKAGGPVFWERAAIELKAYLREGTYGEGLAVCVEELGRALALHFPHDPAVPRNELPDEIVFGK